MAAIVLFDGACDLCNGTVRFILRRDAPGRFRIASQQSIVGRELLDQHGLTTAQPQTVVVIDADQVLTRSDAVIHILRRLGGGWRFVAVLGRFVPRPLRDAGYNLIARHRHVFLRGPASCMIPSPEHAGRFLDRA
jgi:predicted DCC family thiol-disulfide oxidoreductase YuxK